MTIDAVWTDPSEAGSLDLDTGGALTDTVWDAMISNIKHLGGTAGALQTSDAGTVTIDQGAEDGAILNLKSSDVAHGITDYAATDVYGAVAKQAALTGGLKLQGFGEGEVAFQFDSFYTTDDTGKTTAADAAVVIQALKKSGTAFGAPGADANLLVIRASNNATRFIFDNEGTFHADVGSTTFDEFDDVALLEKFDAALTRDPIKTKFGRYLGEYREELQRAKIVDSYDDAEGRTMVNFTRLTMLLVGAVRQSGRRIAELEQRLVAAESRLVLPEGGS